MKTRQIAKYTTGFAKHTTGFAKHTTKIARKPYFIHEEVLIINHSNEQLFDLISPPPAEFDTAQEMLRYCNNHAKQNNYAVATKNSKGEKSITIICDFGGTYQEVRKHPTTETQRQMSSRLNNHPSEIYGKFFVEKWRFVV